MRRKVFNYFFSRTGKCVARQIKRWWINSESYLHKIIFGEIKIPEPMMTPAEIITLLKKVIERRIRSVSLDWFEGWSKSLLICEDGRWPVLHSPCLRSALDGLERRRGSFSSSIFSNKKQFNSSYRCGMLFSQFLLHSWNTKQRNALIYDNRECFGSARNVRVDYNWSTLVGCKHKFYDF